MAPLLALAFGMLCLKPAPAAAAQDPLGPLRGAEQNQLRDGWTGKTDGPWFLLRNDSAKQSEQTLLLERGAAGRAGRYVSATLAVDSKEPSASIGLVVRNTGSGNLCLLEVTAAANANLFCVVNGKNVAIASQSKAAQGGGKDFMQLVETGDGAEFYLNGKKVGAVEPSTLQIDQVGVMAYDTGLFGITDFKAMTLAEAKKALDSKSGGAGAGDTSGGGASGGHGSGGGKQAGDPPGVTLNAMEQRFDGVGPIPKFDGTDVRRVAAYLGITTSIFTHEFGHALINELDLPSTGPEEDAVDIFSALQLVDPTIYKADSAEIDDIGRETAIYGALQWYYSGKLAEANGRGDTPWQDEHTADLKRYRNFFCVIYGGNPKMFGQLAKATDIDERTLSRCEQEYTKQNRAWRTILAPYTRVGPWHPEGTQPANAPGAKVTVEFKPSKYRVGNFIKAAFAESLTGFGEEFSKAYVLPRPLKIVYRDCDQLNAWYSHEDASITMCYNLLENLVSMVSDVEMKTQDGWTVGKANPYSKGAAAAPSNSNAPAQSSASADETADFGVPATLVLFPAPYKGPTPTRIQNASVVATAELASVLKSTDGIILIDTSKSAQTIPGASQVSEVGRDGSLADPLQDQIAEFLDSVTKGDKKRPIVFFGTGVNDRSSYNAALRAGTAGYKAFWYRGGTQAWVAAGLPLSPVGK
jgi:rhodanese-related sulfurtransferase